MIGKERSLDAAERAIGTLPRKGEHPKARRAREEWELRLAALLRPIPPVTPPPGMFARISGHLEHLETRANLVAARRSARRWQGIALIMCLIAAGLAAALLLPMLSP